MEVEIYSHDNTRQKLAMTKLVKDSTGWGLKECKWDVVDRVCDDNQKVVIPLKAGIGVFDFIKEAHRVGFKARSVRKQRIQNLFADERKHDTLKAYLIDEYAMGSDVDFTFDDRGNMINITFNDDIIEITILDIVSWIYSKTVMCV
jgi:hypothetical protein